MHCRCLSCKWRRRAATGRITRLLVPKCRLPPLVSVAKAQAQDVPVYLDEIGKSYAFESVTVTPQVGGRITQEAIPGWRGFDQGASCSCD